MIIVDKDGNVLPAGSLEFAGGAQVEWRGNNVFRVENLRPTDTAEVVSFELEQSRTVTVSREVSAVSYATKPRTLTQPRITATVTKERTGTVWDQDVVSNALATFTVTSPSTVTASTQTVTQSITKDITVTALESATAESTVTEEATVTMWHTVETTAECDCPSGAWVGANCQNHYHAVIQASCDAEGNCSGTVQVDYIAGTVFLDDHGLCDNTLQCLIGVPDRWQWRTQGPGGSCYWKRCAQLDCPTGNFTFVSTSCTRCAETITVYA